MSYQDLRVEIADGVAVLTLDRPAERNAFSGPMGTSLASAYRECDGRDDVRAVVLTGAGSAFCVGADMPRGKDRIEELRMDHLFPLSNQNRPATPNR